MSEETIIEEDIKNIIGKGPDWKIFSGKTILITGANGFLPAYMVKTLLYLNHIYPGFDVKVIALVRNMNKAKSKFGKYLTDKHLSFIEQDVTIPFDIKGKVDYIIHAASQASPKYYSTDPVGTLSANILGTINAIKTAVEKESTSFLFFSSGEVYGEVSDEKVPVKENFYGYLDPVNVRSCYAESKRMGENICASWHHQYGVSAKIVRPFHTYGPGMQLDDGRVYADFVSDVLEGRNIQMKSEGKARRAFCYLSDATSGFFKVLISGIAGEAYNVGNPNEEHSIVDLAEQIAGLFPEKKIKVNRVQPEPGSVYLQSPINRNSPDISKIASLGWQPQTGIAEGFRRTIESYLQTD